MINDILPILPQQLTGTLVALFITLLLVGVVFWFVGAIWYRALVTLIFVGVGGAAGLLLPRWYIWPVNSASTAVLGAVIFGVLAFTIPRLFVGFTLGLVLVAWATLATWVLLRGDTQFQLRPDWQIEQMTPPEHVRDIYNRLPDQVQRVVPYSAATAMISGLALTLLWPKFGRLLMASTLGVTLIFIASLDLIQAKSPDWLRFFPREAEGQIGLLLGLVLLGTLIQWQILPSRKEAQVIDEQQTSPA